MLLAHAARFPDSSRRHRHHHQGPAHLRGTAWVPGCGLTMPLSNIQSVVLQAISQNRSLDSYVAGASVIHAGSSSSRISQDVDIFHDAVGMVARSARLDADSLQAAGFTVKWLEQFPAFFRAVVCRGTEVVEIDWAADSAYRFFPVEADPIFGFRLHPIDAATNKVLALVGRSEIRDLVDCLYLHRRLLSLGALVWAACGKDEGYTPERILNEAKRRARFRSAELDQLQLIRRPDPVKFRQAWEVAVAKASTLAEALPPTELGCLYLDKTGKAVTPNPRRPEFRHLHRHRGTVRGVVPAIFKPCVP